MWKRGRGGGIFYLEFLSSLSSNMEETVEDLILIQVKVPDINVEKTLQFSRCSLIWEAKQQILAALPKVDINIENSLFCLKRTGTQIWSNFDIFKLNFFYLMKFQISLSVPLSPLYTFSYSHCYSLEHNFTYWINLNFALEFCNKLGQKFRKFAQFSTWRNSIQEFESIGIFFIK